MKANSKNQSSTIRRRSFLKSAGIGAIGVAGMGTLSSAKLTGDEKSLPRTRDEHLKQMASNSYAVNRLFKRRPRSSRPERPETLELKEKYGEILRN